MTGPGGPVSAADTASAILACPACATRFRVTDREFAGAAGRTVRCGNCGHVWHATPPVPPPSPPPDHREPLAEAAPERIAASPEAAVQAAAPPPVPRLEAPLRLPPTVPQKPRYSRVIVAAILLLLAAGGALFAHHELAAVPPPSTRLSVSAAETGAASATGLVIRKIAPARTADGLTIDGEIANLGSVAHDVPRLRVVLQDAADKVIQSEVVDPPKPRLQPGEIVHFETPFAHPPDDATGVVVSFASS
jgi:predicted Zn finger-like uncharacterized protein